jgi:hypothetical protein
MDITLIKTLLPKLEKFERRIDLSIASFKVPFKQHHFPQSILSTKLLRRWKAYIGKYGKEKEQALTSQVEDTNDQGS